MEKVEQQVVSVKSISSVTHDVLRIVTVKPGEFEYIPGQATEISINKKGWREESRPFTFTSLPDAKDLEFTIKTYPDRKGVTNELLKLQTGDELILHEVFGAITYSSEGVFIAGGAGVTPFIAIFRDLRSKGSLGENKLIFANKTQADIINKKEFEEMLGENFINILSEEKSEPYYHGLVTESFLKSVLSTFNCQFYVCGPQPMIDSVQSILTDLGVSDNSVTVEL